MRVSVEVETSVPVEDAWRWWTDFGEPGQSFLLDHGMGASRRRILSRAEGRVAMEEEVPLPMGKGISFAQRQVEFGDGHTFHERATGAMTYDADWRFEPRREGGTRIVRDLEMRAPLVDGAGRVGERVARTLMQRDLAHHVRAMERELLAKRD